MSEETQQLSVPVLNEELPLSKNPSTHTNLSKPLSLRQNFSWTFVGNIIYAASQWGILVVIAKLGTPEMVGQFALGLAVTAPIVLFSNLKLRSVLATDTEHDYRFSDYLSLRLLSIVFALLIVIGVVAISEYTYTTRAIIIIIGISKCIESFSDIFYGLYQKYERMDYIARSMIVKGPLSLILMGLGLWLTNNILYACIGLAIARLIMLLIYDIPQTQFVHQFDRAFSLIPSYQLIYLRPLIFLSLPLGIVATLISLTSNIPNYFLVEYAGESQLGIFASLSYIIVAQSILINSNGQAMLPRLASDFVQNNAKSFYNLLVKLVMISVLISLSSVIVALLFGEGILSLLYNAEYASYNIIFSLLMVTAVFINIASVLDYGMVATRKFLIQIPIYSTVIVAIIIVGIITIPQYGMIGMVITIIVGAIIQIFGNLIMIVYYMNQKSNILTKNLE